MLNLSKASDVRLGSPTLIQRAHMRKLYLYHETRHRPGMTQIT